MELFGSVTKTLRGDFENVHFWPISVGSKSEKNVGQK